MKILQGKYGVRQVCGSLRPPNLAYLTGWCTWSQVTLWLNPFDVWYYQVQSESGSIFDERKVILSPFTQKSWRLKPRGLQTERDFLALVEAHPIIANLERWTSKT